MPDRYDRTAMVPYTALLGGEARTHQVAEHDGEVTIEGCALKSSPGRGG
jgi:hypothetical protein